MPSEEFALEKPHLREYKGVPTPPVENLAPHHVRKDNVINFRGNYYAVPTGTYAGHNTIVYLEEKDGKLIIYSSETGKTLATHSISSGRGELVSSTSLRRDRDASLDEYESQVRAKLPQTPAIDQYLAELRKRKPRNLRDNLQFVAKGAAVYSSQTLAEAFQRCLDASVYNGHDLVCVAESIRISKNEPCRQPAVNADETIPKASTANMTPEKTDISTFSHIFQ